LVRPPSMAFTSPHASCRGPEEVITISAAACRMPISSARRRQAQTDSRRSAAAIQVHGVTKSAAKRRLLPLGDTPGEFSSSSVHRRRNRRPPRERPHIPKAKERAAAAEKTAPKHVDGSPDSSGLPRKLKGEAYMKATPMKSQCLARCKTARMPTSGACSHAILGFKREISIGVSRRSKTALALSSGRSERGRLPLLRLHFVSCFTARRWASLRWAIVPTILQWPSASPMKVAAW